MRGARLRHARRTGARRRSAGRRAADPARGLDQESLDKLLVELGRDGARDGAPEGRRSVRLRARRRGGGCARRGGRPVRGRARACPRWPRCPPRSGSRSRIEESPHRSHSSAGTRRRATTSTSPSSRRRPGRSSSSWACVRLARIVDGLIAHGKDPHTPAAIVARGTLPDGELVEGTLGRAAGACVRIAAAGARRRRRRRRRAPPPRRASRLADGLAFARGDRGRA